MSLMVPSLSNGSIGPRPVISSRISVTKPASSWVLSARRSARMYCDTSCWTCLRISSSGSFSSAERLISSISLRCRRTLASSSLSVSSGLFEGGVEDAAAAGAEGVEVTIGAGAATGGAGGGIGAGGGGASGNTVQVKASGSAVPAPFGSATASSCGGSSATAVRRAVKRPAMRASACPGERQLLGQAADRRGRLLGLRHDHLLEREGDVVALLDLFERHAAVDRLAHQPVVVRDHVAEVLAEHLAEVVLAQSGAEHALVVAVDDHARARDLLQAVADRGGKLAGLAQT